MEIIYLIGRHDPVQVIAYRIAKGRAFRITGPKAVNQQQGAYWDKHGIPDEERHPEKLKTFGTSKAGKHADGYQATRDATDG